MAGYTRQSAADIVASAVIKAAPIDAEFQQVLAAFNASTGHKHDGTTAEGAFIPIISDTDQYNKVCIDTSNNHIRFFTEVSSAAAEQVRIQDGGIVPTTTNDVDLGTSSLKFKDIHLAGNGTVGGTFAVTGNTTLSGTLGITGVTTFSDTVCAPAFTATGTSTLSTVDINAGNIDNTVIGASTAAAGSFTTVSTTGQGTFASVDINGGNIDGTTIGASTACPGTFSSLTATTANIDGGTVDGAVIGGSSSAAGTFTDLTTTGTSTHATVDINGGAIDGTTIGGSTAAAITGTTVTANTCFIGNVTGDAAGCHTGNFDGTIGATTSCPVTGTVITADTCFVGDITGAVTGNVTGNLTGNVTGNLTGNVTSTGTSTFCTLQLNGDMTANSNKITNLAAPTADSDAATKLYVDNAVEGLDVKGSVKGATTANITLSGSQTIDGVSITAGDRVLVKDQSSAAENGVYVASGGSWSRADDADTWDKHVGAFFFVEQGTANADNGFVGTVDAGGTLGTTAITFVQFSGAGQITAGTGLTKSGNTINVVTADSGRIVTNADNIDLATTGVSAGTFKSVTVDTYGRITAGTNPTTLSGYGITDAYTKTCSNTLLDAKLNLAGGTMTGDITLGSNKITSTATPATADTLTRKGYVDTMLPLAGGTMTGAIDMGSNKITTTYTPTDNADLTTKTYVDSILGSSTAAATSATAAAASATAAASSETAACSSKDAAAASATSAANSYDQFDDRYLGDKSSNPSVDNDGSALLTGAIYWNTTDNALKIYTGSAWSNAAFTLGDALTCVQEDTTPTLGGNLDANSKCITNAANICATNLCGAVTGNVTGNVTGTVSSLSNHDTGDLAEGSNQYFTTARVDSHLSGGTGVTYSSGSIAIGQSVGISDNVCFGSVCVSANPTLACQLATKEYVDTIAAAGLHYHDPVRVQTTANLSATYDNGSSGVGATLTNNSTQAALTIDGVALSSADRVLVTEQTNAAHNGVYTVTTVGSGSTNWVLTRSTDTDSSAPSDPDALGRGDAFFIKEGTVNAGHLDVLTTQGTITFGTTNITFAEVAETSIYSAGNGITLTGTVFSADPGTGVTVDANGINIGQAVGTSDTVTFARVCAPVTGAVTGNADTASAWATARTLCVCGAVTGSTTVDGSGNFTVNTTATSDPTLTINGDASGSATFTNLGNATLTLTIADDSHNHTVANVDGLATCLSNKAASTGSLAVDFCANCLYADTKVCSPIICGSTCAISPVVCGTCLKAQNCVHSGIFCVTSCITGAPYIAQVCGCATACFKSPIICGTTCVVAPDINATSDCRCKDNITTVENAYCKIGQIRGVNYNWKDSGKYTLGVVAQEVEEVLPELVTEDEEGFKSVNYNGLVGVLIETVKCLQDKVEELENGSKG